ncbi:hypothetical protein D3C79_938950 [compost metagenome]
MAEVGGTGEACCGGHVTWQWKITVRMSHIDVFQQAELCIIIRVISDYCPGLIVMNVHFSIQVFHNGRVTFSIFQYQM